MTRGRAVRGEQGMPADRPVQIDPLSTAAARLEKLRRWTAVLSFRRWIAALIALGLAALALLASTLIVAEEIGPGGIWASLFARPVSAWPGASYSLVTYINMRPWLVLGGILALPVLLFLWLYWMLRFGGFLSRAILAGLAIRSLQKIIAWTIGATAFVAVAVVLYMAVFYVVRTRFEQDTAATRAFSTTPALVFASAFPAYDAKTQLWILPDAETKRAALFGLAAPLGLLVALIGLFASRRERMIHGRARLGTLLDAADAGLKSRRGIVLGSLQGQLLVNDSDQHVLVVGSPGMGKSQGIVIPSIMRFGGSMVCLDFEGVLWKRTSGWLKTQGYRTYILNPGSDRTDSFNPLDYVDPDPTRRITDLQKLASILIPDSEFSGDSIFWKDSARNLTASLLSFLVECKDARPTLGELYRILGAMGDERAAINRLLKAFGRQLSEETVLGLQKFVGRHDKLGEGIAAELATKLEPLANNYLEAMLSVTTIPIEKLRREKMAIFIAVTPMTLATYRRFIVLFLEKVMDVLIGLGEMGNQEHDVMLMLDEFGNAGEIDTLLTMMPLMRKYGLRVVPIVQDTAQIERNYQRTGSEIFRTSATIQVYLNFASSRDAKYISELAGTTTVFLPTSRYSFQHGRRQRHADKQAIAKPLLSVAALQSLPDHKAILRVAGFPVFEVAKIEGYQDPRFAALKLHAPVTPPEVKIARSNDLGRRIMESDGVRTIFISDLKGLTKRLRLFAEEEDLFARQRHHEGHLPPHDPETGEIWEQADIFSRSSARPAERNELGSPREAQLSFDLEHAKPKPRISRRPDADRSKPRDPRSAPDSASLDDTAPSALAVVDAQQESWLETVTGQASALPLEQASVADIDPIALTAARHIALGISDQADRRAWISALIEPVPGEDAGDNA